MTDGAYRVRNGIFGAERRYRLTRDALCWAESGRSDGRLAYADTRSMRLMSYASPIGRALQCTLKSKSGEKIIIRSAHYLDLGEFEDRSARYGPFVRELSARIGKASPNAQFTAGSTLFWIAWIVVAAIWAVVLALFSAALFDVSLLAGLTIALGLGAICLPLIWHEVRQGGSRGFDPLNPPGDLLGAQSADLGDGASSSDR
ncbi:MAG: hypothetical protein QNJ62_07370 [Methyloceanibacter sp.]|nr:hypothetical protein [Methyloceanibacter sp.]